MNIWLVGGGGFLGAIARYGVGKLVPMPGGLPIATLTVNLTGCLAIGLLAGTLSARTEPSAWWLFLATGFLGAFTTFSAFSLDNLRMLEAGQLGWTVANVFIQVLGGLAAAWLGHAVLTGSPSP